MEEWVSISDAARRLSAIGDTISQSSLSRYLKQHAEALATRVSGKATLVELGALIQHRRENIRLRVPVADTARPQHGARRFAGSQSDGAARKAQADAEMREMDLAARRGELMPTAEAAQAGRDAVALMLSAFERAMDTEAATFSVKYGLEERIWRVALKVFARHGLETFNQAIRERLDQRRRADEFGGADGEGASLQ